MSQQLAILISARGYWTVATTVVLESMGMPVLGLFAAPLAGVVFAIAPCGEISAEPS